MKMIKHLIYVLCLLGVWLSVTGCNTTKGAGQDIQAGGRAIERAAE
jgi:entericidin B